MTDINLVDVVVHIDEELDAEGLMFIEDSLREDRGVVSVHFEQGRSHLALVDYNPELTDSQAILSHIRKQNLHGELIGL